MLLDRACVLLRLTNGGLPSFGALPLPQYGYLHEARDEAPQQQDLTHTQPGRPCWPDGRVGLQADPPE